MPMQIHNSLFMGAGVRLYLYIVSINMNHLVAMNHKVIVKKIRVASKKRKMQMNNRTGLSGLHFCNTWNKYRCVIQIERKPHHIGYFAESWDAICAIKSFCNCEGK